ncbi:LysR family transcriptional regulator [Azohydromonas australica]|uniref:LysR family transcriptional regulator n=1 Tax=Azohydromonas australica TaxID=364039 RepID=UPI00040CF9C1|nr:LysR family transcriptional regulator [Azohydromonas australica]
MDLRQLNYFIAVAETRHLGRAAERLHLSQPPLTRQIQQLEAELGVQLFRRTPRGMELTQAGEELLRDAQNIRTLVSQAAERAQRAGLGQAGRLDVGVYGSAMFGLVPEVLSAFRARHPDVELVLHYAQTPAQLPALRQGRVHLVFERMLPEESDIEVELVAREPLLLGMAEGHPLAAQEHVDVSALRDETMLIGTSPSIAAMSLQLCRAHGFEPRLAPPASDVVTATLLAAAGLGVTLVPDSMSNVRFPGITYRPLHSRVEAFMELHCFYLRGEPSPLLAAMLETVRGFRERTA